MTIKDEIETHADSDSHHELGAWVVLSFSVGLLTLALTRSLSLLRSDDYIVRREHWCAVRTTLVMTCLSALVAWPSFFMNAQEWIPGIRGVYPWLGFWLLGNCKCYAGAYLEVALHSLAGTVLMLGFMFVLHVLMPGGAGYIKRDIVIFGGALIPGGYRQAFAMVIGMIFTYGVQLTSWNKTTKGFCLALLSETILLYMTPHREIQREIFYGVLIDTDMRINWRGPAMVSLYTIVAAVALGALALPIFRPWRLASREWVSAHSQVATWQREIAVDTMGVLSHLIDVLTLSHIGNGAARKFDLLAVGKDIRKLGARRSEADALLAFADWEVFGRARLKRRVAEMKRFSAVLRDMRQVIRLLSEQCASAEELQGFEDVEVGVLLADFQVLCVKAMESLLRNTCCSTVHRTDNKCCTERRRADCLEAAKEADDMLVQALDRLCALSLEENALYSLEFSIVDNLRRWPAAVIHVVNVQNDMIQMRKHTFTWHWQHLIPTRQHTCTIDSHLDALRLLTAWTTGLFWCIYRRDFSSGCLMNIAFLFSPSVGSMRELSINRLLGVALGIVFGNLPATLLMYGAGDTMLPRFEDMPAYLVTYLIFVTIALLISTHGYMSSSSTMKSSYYLWAGFMVSVQITHLVHEYTDERVDLSASLFMIVMDNLMACLILLITDLLYARFVTGTTVERASWSLSAGLESTSEIMMALAEGRIEDAHEHTSQLDWHIKRARYWDAEAAKEDPLMMPDFAKRYDAEMVGALLDQLDLIHIAARSFASSTERLEHGAEGAFPQELARLSTLYAEALRALLMGGEKRRKLVQRAAGKLKKNHTVDLETVEKKTLRRSESTAELVKEVLQVVEEMEMHITDAGLQGMTIMQPKRGEGAASQAARRAMFHASGIISTAMQEIHALVHACAVARGKEDALVSDETFMGTTTRPFPRCNTSALLAGRSRTSTKASVGVSTKLDQPIDEGGAKEAPFKSSSTVEHL